jgi:hypothetical protein
MRRKADHAPFLFSGLTCHQAVAWGQLQTQSCLKILELLLVSLENAAAGPRAGAALGPKEICPLRGAMAFAGPVFCLTWAA